MIFRSTFKRPIVIVGNGVRAANAVEYVHEFYFKTKIPVLTTMNAVDIMQDACKIGFIGVYGNRAANMIVSQCDLVISIGARLGLRQIGHIKECFAPNAHLIRADIDPHELSRDVKENEEKYLIDAKEFLQKLLNENIPIFEEWNSKCFAVKKLLSDYDKEIGNLCLERISSILPENSIVAVDIGQAQCWAAQSLNLKGMKGRILIGGSYGSMGCGLPYAIGACIAEKEPVFCITGDGGLQMNIQELQTVVSEDLPIKIFVINNKALGKIYEIQAGEYDNRMLITTEESGYKVPDFEKVASAYGIRAITLHNYTEINTLSEWLKDDKPCLINLIVPQANTLLPKLNWNEREMKPLLEHDVMEQAHRLLCE